MRIWTIGHGTRSGEELMATLGAAEVRTLVDVRRYPGSRRNPQFGQAPLAASLAEAASDTSTRRRSVGAAPACPGRSGSTGCVASFRSYAAWMGSEAWQAALERSLALPAACFMCAERLPWRCHRHLIADLLAARGVEVVHLLGPDEELAHLPFEGSAVEDGRLFLCGSLVA